MERGTVTVLLAVYNGGPHLRTAVASILGQTYSDLELLVVDDGSTDGSGAWLDGISDPRVHVVHQSNQGLVAALNRGLTEARTELVARMDADDVSAPQRIERQVRFLADNPRVAAVGSCYEVVDTPERVTETVHVAAEPEYLRRRLYFRNTFAHSSMMFRRSAVLDAGGYRDVGPVEDYDLWIRLTANHDLAALPDSLLSYRRSHGGISAGQRDRQLASLADVRAHLHESRPLVAPPVREVVAQGRRHHEHYHETCPQAVQTYVYDHAWLAILAARQRQLAAAARLAGAVALLLVRHPRAVGGLPGLSELGARRRGRRAP